MTKYRLSSSFDEGSTFKIMDAPVRLSGGILFQEDVTSFDVRVYDRDATRPHSPRTPIFEALGQDPTAYNPSGGQFFLANPSPATVYRTDNNWRQDRRGYVFEYDVDSLLWDRVEGGHTYAVEVIYNSLNDGQVYLTVLMECTGSLSE